MFANLELKRQAKPTEEHYKKNSPCPYIFFLHDPYWSPQMHIWELSQKFGQLVGKILAVPGAITPD